MAPKTHPQDIATISPFSSPQTPSLFPFSPLALPPVVPAKKSTNDRILLARGTGCWLWDRNLFERVRLRRAGTTCEKERNQELAITSPEKGSETVREKREEAKDKRTSRTRQQLASANKGVRNGVLGNCGPHALSGGPKAFRGFARLALRGRFVALLQVLVFEVTLVEVALVEVGFVEGGLRVRPAGGELVVGVRIGARIGVPGIEVGVLRDQGLGVGVGVTAAEILARDGGAGEDGADDGECHIHGGGSKVESRERCVVSWKG